MERITKLTIGIPVYNGEKYIAQTLDSILNQLNYKTEEQIKILISDNASKDNTRIIIDEYLIKYTKFIQYYRNEENLGYDKNIDLIVTRATGEYIWFLGCGEILKKESIDFILKELNKDKYDNILLNFDIYSEEISGIDVENSFGIYENQIFLNKDDFFKNTITGITPISANIVSREAYLEVIDTPLIVSGWVHVERIIDIISRKKYCKTLWLSNICFSLIRDIDGWWTKKGNLLLNSLNLQKIYNTMGKKGYDKKTINIFRKNFKIQHLINYIILGKRQKLKINYKLLYELTLFYYNKIGYWFLVLPLIILPISFIKKTLLLRKYLIKK